MSGRLRLCKKWKRQIQKGLVRALFVLRLSFIVSRWLVVCGLRFAVWQLAVGNNLF